MSLENSVAGILEKQTDRFYGKYRGLVLINVDPQNQGRIKAVVPEVLGVFPSNWCLPCTPYAGAAMPAGLFAIPMPGTGVWIEFEAGDVNRPVWTGCWWGTAQVPINNGVPSQFTNKTLTTDTGLSISLDDAMQKITFTDLVGLNKMTMMAGIIQINSQAMMVLESKVIMHGQAAVHPAVLGDELLAYLNQLVTAFNTHVHIGEVAAGIFPVIPTPPQPMVPPATPNLLSTKNLVE